MTPDLQTAIGVLKSIGPIRCATPIRSSTGGVVVEVTYKDPQHNAKAIQEGVKINGQAVKAYNTVRKSSAITQVRVTGVPHVSDQEIIDIFSSTLSAYGRVLSISLLISCLTGVWMGDVAILQDCSTENEQTHAPLPRSVFVDAWEGEYELNWHGQPPICRYCKKEGHIKFKCPVLAQQECYECGAKGHTRARCPRQDDQQTESEQLDEYIRLREQRATVPTIPSINVVEMEASARQTIPPTPILAADNNNDTFDTDMLDSEVDAPTDGGAVEVVDNRTQQDVRTANSPAELTVHTELTNTLITGTPVRRNPPRAAKTQQMALMEDMTATKQRQSSRGASRADY